MNRRRSIFNTMSRKGGFYASQRRHLVASQSWLMQNIYSSKSFFAPYSSCSWARAYRVSYLTRRDV